MGSMRALGVVLSACGVMFSGSAWAAPAGAHVFEVACAPCHGAQGEGAGPRAQFLPVAPADLRVARQRAPDDIAAIVRDGGQSAGLRPQMPAFRDALPEAEIAAVARYVKTLQSTEVSASGR